ARTELRGGAAAEIEGNTKGGGIRQKSRHKTGVWYYTPMRPAMTCQEIETAELAEKYVLGQLDSKDQEAYESHYFRCSRCFEELQLRQGMQAELGAMKASRPVPLARQRPHAWITW